MQKFTKLFWLDSNLRRYNRPNWKHQNTIAFIIKILNLLYHAFMYSLIILLSSIYPFTQCLSLLVTIIENKIKRLNWNAFWKWLSLSNWQRQFDVLPWIAKGYCIVSISFMVVKFPLQNKLPLKMQLSSNDFLCRFFLL